ncbi:MAG TPA: DUF4339 domain-containing protein, partial [Gemmataceae bacterium]|nr:DUF4339 domain-containing protein [Gemmataceae bacterium]
MPAPAADASQPAWYIARNKQKLGPYSSSQLKRLVKSGEVGPADMVLREGERQWVAAAVVQGLFAKGVGPAVRPASPVISPEAAAAPFAFDGGATAANSGRARRRHAPRSPWPWLLGTAAAALAVLGGLAVLGMRLLQPSASGDKAGTEVAKKSGKPEPVKPVKASEKPARPNPSPEPRPAKKKALDLSYIAADFNAAVVLRPARLVKSPVAEALAQEKLLGAILQETGIDPHKLEQAVVVMDPFPAGKPLLPKKNGIVGAKWRKFTSREGRFSALFPVKPVEKSVKQKKLPLMHLFKAEWEGGQMTYSVVYTDFGTPADDPKAYLETVASSVAKYTHGKKSIKIDGYPGLELKLEITDPRVPTVVTHRIYLVKDRQYEVIVSSAKAKHDPAQFAKFLDSFTLLDDKGKARESEKSPAAEAAPAVILFAPGVILRFVEAVDGKQLLARNLKEVEEKTFTGKKYYRSTREKLAGAALAGYVADDRTVLWAPEPTLHKMLASSAAEGPLIERLRDVDPDDEATGVFVLGPFGEM